MKFWLAVVALCIGSQVAWAGDVGFQEIKVPDGADRPLVAGIWYPTSSTAADQAFGGFVQTVAPDGKIKGGRLPLVVMSHGSGGWYGEHDDTALALAQAGFVVAALSHTGDTFDDHSQSAELQNRPRQLRELVDFMIGEWMDHGAIDPARIGAFGFSSGGFTVLVAAGGVPDLSGVGPHCRAHPDYFDCGVLKAAHRDPQTVSNPPPSAWTHDPRIEAAVVAAPAMGFAFTRSGLKDVGIPIQLWRAEADHILPAPDYADAVRASLPRSPDFHVVANADHFDFLAPCTPQLAREAPMICVSQAGFDRVAFHARFNAEIVRFFRNALK